MKLVVAALYFGILADCMEAPSTTAVTARRLGILALWLTVSWSATAVTAKGLDIHARWLVSRQQQERLDTVAFLLSAWWFPTLQQRREWAFLLSIPSHPIVVSTAGTDQQHRQPSTQAYAFW